MSLVVINQMEVSDNVAKNSIDMSRKMVCCITLKTLMKLVL